MKVAKKVQRPVHQPPLAPGREIRMLTPDVVEALDVMNTAVHTSARDDMKRDGLPEWLATSIARVFGLNWQKGLAAETFGPYTAIFTFGGKWPAVDKFATTRFGISGDAPLRVAAAMHEVLSAALREGHCYEPLHTATMGVAALLKRSSSDAQILIERVLASDEYPLELDGRKLMLRTIADDERLIARHIRGLRTLAPRPVEAWTPHDDVHDLSPEQADAVTLIQSSPVGVVTGGPGTGKTTSLREACFAIPVNLHIALCAPTGKAARRMTEATGIAATTIHRLLKYNPKTGFLKNAADRLEVDVVIVDESSMLDVSLAARLFDALAPHTRIIFVGDVDQLPPVGPGAFFRDLITSETVPVVRLTTVHRHAAGSWVAINAPRILAGAPIDMSDRPDFEYWQVNGDASGLGKIVAEVLEALYVQGFQPHDHVVLTPRKTPGVPGSTDDLNTQLQQRFNPTGQSIDVGSRMLRVGDRVIQTRNDYERNVMNGDLGVLSGVGYNKDKLLGAEVLVGDLKPSDIQHIILGEVPPLEPTAYRRASTDAFERMLEQLEAASAPTQVDDVDVEPQTRTVIYTVRQLYALQLGYALTIHKSQGSEWPVVVVLCHSCHGGMLTRKLLYTALTRASRKVVLIGDPAGLKSALSVVRDDARRTMLRGRLCGG